MALCKTYPTLDCTSQVSLAGQQELENLWAKENWEGGQSLLGPGAVAEMSVGQKKFREQAAWDALTG